MGSEWEYAELGDLVQIKGGKRLPKGEALSEQPNSHPYVRVRDLTDGRINTQDLLFVPDEVFEKIRRYTVDEGDIIVTIVGTVGLVATTPPSLHKASLTENAAKLIVSEEDKLDSEFLKWFLMSHQGRHQIEINTVGSTQPKLPIYGIANIALPLPPLPEQKAIAHILGTLDDKIELNRRMNATLEGMAQALFKSWFVDFDPVIDNALAAGNPIPEELAPRAEVRKNALANGTTQQGSLDHPTLSDPKSLFPAVFEYDEELGPIPEGWEVKQVKDFGSVVCGKTPSKSNADYYGDDVSFIKIPDMHHSAWITETTDGLSFAGANSQAKKQIPAKSISVSCIATVGKVVITSEPSHTNQQINSVIPNAEHSRNYLYFSFLEKNKELHDLASGGSATLNLNTGVFSKIRLLAPPATVLELYHEATDPLFEKMLANDRESQSFTKLRDTLLPKLISGEIVTDALEEANALQTP